MASFELADARQMLPEVRAHTRQLIAVRADLAETRAIYQREETSLAEVKGLEARLAELLEWYPQRGIEVKGIAPVILDFPGELAGDPVLLCWLEGERELAWYHRPELGFLGRRLLPDAEPSM